MMNLKDEMVFVWGMTEEEADEILKELVLDSPNKYRVEA